MKLIVEALARCDLGGVESVVNRGIDYVVAEYE